MNWKAELEARLRGHTEALDAEVGPRTGLEERLLLRAIARPPAVARRVPLFRELAVAAGVLMVAAAAGFGVIQLRAAHQPTALKGTDPSLPARLSYTPGVTVPAGPVQLGSARTGVTMKMFTSKRGWAIGPAGKGLVSAHDALLVTADGGSHWRNVTPPDSSGQPKVLIPFFLDASHAWVSVAPEAPRGGRQPLPATTTIFRTDDGGATWRKSIAAVVEGTPSELDFVDATHGWLVLATPSSDVYIYRTADGGVRWSLVSRQPLTQVGDSQPVGTLPLVADPSNSGQASCGFDSFAGITFHNSSTGWATGLCSGPVAKPYFYVSHDAGRTWNAGAVPPIPATTTCPCWVSSTAPVFTSPRDGTSVVTTSSLQTRCETHGTSTGCTGEAIPRHSFVYVTSDGGSNWSLHELPGLTSFGGDPALVAGGTGWYAAARLKAGSVVPNETVYEGLYVTHDGGASWAPLTTGANFQGGILTFINSSTGWVLNGFGSGLQTFLQTKDGGRTWQELNPVVTG